MKYRITFDRVGRNHNPEPVFIEASDAEDLAAKIFAYIIRRKLLASREFEVTVDLTKMSGSIDFGRFGEFTIEEVK
jgi:hypothetical protein